MNLIVAGVGTDVGKTVTSAILCSAFEFDYWKPVQAGDLDKSDSLRVAQLVQRPDFTIYPERYKLTEAMSPHAAAEIDRVHIKLADFTPPAASRTVIELAGGLMVPFNDNDLSIDLIEQLQYPVVFVMNYYLGSINHTLLSLELLKQRGIELVGIIGNGEVNQQTREVILGYSGAELLAEIPQAALLDQKFIAAHAREIRKHPRLAQL